ncbi:MAG: alpha/beta hydrolase [Lachnospiraceae bacterium]|nr:alpha/beta hydrolase [Lachnospiraceae bacterium]
MINYHETIWEDGEYSYEAAYGFVPNIYTYLHEDDVIRPCLLLIPGGGYCMVCNVEGEPVADVFNEIGMNVIVLTYTTDITMSIPLKMQPLMDASRAIRYIRKNADRFRIDPDKITVMGFSAGGHLSASLSVHYDDVHDINPEYDKYSNRPNGTILGYPVITSGEETHQGSIISLIGNNPSKEELEYFSLEKQVTPNTPPCFCWQTVEDDLVPIENSMLYTEALQKNGVPHAFYAFPHGRHGLSVSTDRVKNNDFGEPYTFEQLDLVKAHILNDTLIKVSDMRKQELKEQFFPDEEPEPMMPNPDDFFDDVAMWPTLAKEWLKGMNLL